MSNHDDPHDPRFGPPPQPDFGEVAHEGELGYGTELPMVPATVGELQELVDEMLIVLQQARSVPLSGSVMIDRHDFEAKLQRLRADLPEELRAARWMIRERESFIAKTNERGREIIKRAKDKAAELVSETQVMSEAVAEANYLVRNAENEATRIRLEAEDTVEQSLEHVDHLLTDILERIRTRRAELHRSRPRAPDVPYSE